MPILHDLSPLISPALAVWPGDTPPTREVLLDLARGDSVTLSTLRTTVHLGSHADAPSHYGLGAPDMADCALDRFVGLCEVIAVPAGPREQVTAAMLPSTFRAPRVLLATGSHPDRRVLNGEFASLAPGAVDKLHQAGVFLVGTDAPSVDPLDSKELPAHHRFLAHGMYILEGLVLDGVPPGFYELIALPLRLVGFEASPVRAVLRSPQSL
jgi:arylformamidase